MIDDYDTYNYVVLAVLIFYITEFLSDSSTYVRVKLNPGLPWQKLRSTRRLSLPVKWI
jgi:hypothetical protein